jgi:DNA-binding Lrp family transcriptional regulator
MDGATWTTKAAVSSAPRPVRPRIRYAAISIAAQAAIGADGRSPGRSLRPSRIASVPASAVAEEDGTSGPVVLQREVGERLFGDPDYLIRVATADLAAYQELRDNKLAALPGVQRLSSTILMKRIVEDRPYAVRR